MTPTARIRVLAVGAALLAALSLFACQGVVDFVGGGDDDDNNDDGGDPNDPPGQSLYFYYGPMKLMYGESILYSLTRVTGHDFGDWDNTAPDPGSQAFAAAGNATEYYLHCRLLGGCMEHRIPLGRTSFVGTAYVLQLEKAVAEACYDRAALGMFPGNEAPAPSVQSIDVIRHQYLVAFGEEPSQADLEASIAYFSDHIAGPEMTDVSALESAGRGHCRALLTTNRFLFY